MIHKLIAAFLSVLLFSLLLQSQTILVKNANVLLPNGSWQADSFIIIEGCKIRKIGPMKEATLDKHIFHKEYDAEKGYVYPAFIDPYYCGLQKASPSKKGKQKNRQLLNKNTRKPSGERNWHITHNAVTHLEMKESLLKKILTQGFATLHLVPARGIIG
ncbi:MAG: hypothetical protein GY765_41825, partial [bacterium]|nr:hypothetical protein [bacterium]